MTNNASTPPVPEQGLHCVDKIPADPAAVRTAAEKLYAQLQRLQEPKGYFFNRDREMTLELLEQLANTKATYGYMACPCRLAGGVYENDKDIICPCEYRAADVQEFGSCFCGLYVSKDWNEDAVPHEIVPERRPPEKIMF